MIYFLRGLGLADFFIITINFKISFTFTQTTLDEDILYFDCYFNTV